MRFLLSLLIFLPLFILAQEKESDTVIHLKQIEISGTRTGLSLTGSLTEQIDSSALSESSDLGKALKNMIQLNIKSNGASGSSSLYLRGTNSVHNAVFWNGFNLAFGSLGSTDLTLLPAVLFDNVAINYGGAASQFGSGVIGGSVNMQNLTVYERGTNALLSLEKFSFNNFTLSARTGFSRRKFAFTTAASLVENENNFRYKNDYKKKDTLDHARFRQFSILQQAGYKLNRNNEIKAGWWFYNTFREISPTLLIAENDQTQDDQALRGFLEYVYNPGLWNFNLKAYFNDEEMRFNSNQAGIHTVYHLKGSQFEADAKRVIGRFTIAAGLQHRRQNADVPAYFQAVNEIITALFSSVEYTSFSSRFSAGLYARQDLQSNQQIPFCPSSGVKWIPLKNLEIGASVSRNFRLPTLNDRYWIPGGNPDILPEKSFNQDISVKYSGKVGKGKTEYFITVSAYNMLINDLIQWIPITSAIWSPVNRDVVWSRGISQNSGVKFIKGKFRHAVKTSYTYSPSTMSSGNSERYQLIYIPRHKADAEYTMLYHDFSASVIWHLIGKRFTTTDNNSFLPFIQLADIEINQVFTAKNLNLNLFLTINNLFNTDFQMVMNYPESLRYFSLKLIVQYKKSPVYEN